MIEERRRYFRIDDTLGICLRVLGPHEAQAFVRETAKQGSNFDFISNFDNRIQTLLDACKVQTPLAAEIIDLMNKKLNFIIRQLDVEDELIKHVAFEPCAVNISACGIAFAHQHYLEADTALQLDIQLTPSDLHIVTLATVVVCKEMDHPTCTEQKPFYLRLDFSQINDSDQELLIQHVVKRQSEQLKRKRRQNASDDTQQ